MKRSASSTSQNQSRNKKEECSSVEENDDEKDETKRKSRNLSEKKRRDQFNMLINELCSMVSTNNRKMDKSSVLRSTIAFLRNHSDVAIQSQSLEVQENWKPSFLSNEEFTHLMLEAFDGFVIVFASSGNILYVSESITSLLGYLPSDLNGTNIFDVIHESDKPSIHKLWNTAMATAASLPGGDIFSSSLKGSCMSLHVHMKHGPAQFSSQDAASTPYELVRLVGTFHHLRSSISEDGAKSHSDYELSFSPISAPRSSSSSSADGWASTSLCFVSLACLQTPQLLREMTVGDGAKNEFTSRHSLEWKFLFLDHRAPPIIGYLPFEVLGTSGYDYYHVDDLDKVAECHEALMQTGEGTSCYYRFLTKGQQWIWLQTRYYITYHQWNSKPEFIVCTHTVVSYDQVRSSFKAKDRAAVRCKNGSRTAGYPSPIPALNEAATNNDTSGTLAEDTPSSEYPLTPLGEGQPPAASSSAVPKTDKTTTLSAVTSTKLPPNQIPKSSPSSSSSMLANVTQTQLQDYLRRRHQLLQQQILLQQEELQRVSEQLMLVQFAAAPSLPPQQPFHPLSPQPQGGGTAEQTIPILSGAAKLTPAPGPPSPAVAGTDHVTLEDKTVPLSPYQQLFPEALQLHQGSVGTIPFGSAASGCALSPNDGGSIVDGGGRGN